MTLSPRLRLVWAVLAVIGTGCTSITSMQRAQTLGKGKFEFSLEPGVVAGVSTNAPGFGVAPRADLAGHFGVSDQVDLGFRLGSVGLEFMTNFQVTRRSSPVVHVSLAPSINAVYLFLGGTSGAGGGLLGFQLPILIGIDTGGGSEFIIAPRIVDQLVIGGGGGSTGAFNTVLLGGALGYSIQITEHFRIHPEVGVVAPVLGTVASGSTVSTGGFTFGGLIIQGTLGFQFGN